MKVCLLPLTLVLGAAVATAAPPPLAPPVKSWLAAQTNVHTWSADFVQTRTLQSLTVPLTATGHVWFAAPARFRWELGRPPESIAVGSPTNLSLIYPQLKRVEQMSLTGRQAGPWRDALAMLQAGFPRSEAALNSQYEILSQPITNGICRLRLQPKSAAARRLMPRIEIDLATQDGSLRGTELEFADGSKLRNDFEHAVLNPKLDASLFAPAIPPDYTVTEPLKQR